MAKVPLGLQVPMAPLVLTGPLPTSCLFPASFQCPSREAPGLPSREAPGLPSRTTHSLSPGRGHLCSRLCFQMLKRWTVARSAHQPREPWRPGPDTETRPSRAFRNSVPRSRSLRQDQGELGASQRAGPGEKPDVAHRWGERGQGTPD